MQKAVGDNQSPRPKSERGRLGQDVGIHRVVSPIRGVVCPFAADVRPAGGPDLGGRVAAAVVHAIVSSVLMD